MIRADAALRQARQPLTRHQRWTAMAVCALAGIGYFQLASWSERHALFVNASASLPNWAFLIDRDRLPARGDHVFFDPPASALLERHFGRDHDPFVKIVYGVAGDRVTRRGRLFFDNNRPVALAKTATLRGEPLAVGPVGTIPRGCYFVATPNKDSFDSRYALIGWICRPRILGVGEPIL